MPVPINADNVWAEYDQAYALTPALERRAERLMQRSKASRYPVFFSHNGRSLRLELASCFGHVVASVVLVDNSSDQAILQISKSAEALYREATR